ncbi:MAG: hypothetical protein L6Q97_03985 [Thermoanaerobaculia bacterium]|nr:hypothetical protein [Thermoanaerobaculia bacterium]
MQIRFFACLLLFWHYNDVGLAQTDQAFPAATSKGIYRFDDGSYFETLTGWVKEVVKEEQLIKRP